MAYAIAIAANAGTLPSLPMSPLRVAAGGLAIVLSVPLAGLAIWVGIRWRCFNVAWRRAGPATKIALLVWLAVETAVAVAGWIAFLLVIRGPA